MVVSPAGTEPKVSTVVFQRWEESERGWGTRPDGYSLHLTKEDREAFIQEYWDRQPKGEVPDEYSRPEGEPYFADIGPDLFTKLSNSKNGIWEHSRPPAPK